MKALSIALALTITLSLPTLAATSIKSEQVFKDCTSKVFMHATKSNQSSKDNLKSVSIGVKECRQLVSAMKKEEAANKKIANNAKRVSKLKEQLAKLTK